MTAWSSSSAAGRRRPSAGRSAWSASSNWCRTRTPATAPHAYLVPVGVAQAAALALAESLRDAAGLRLLTTHCGEASLKAAMKKADKSGAALALILGDDELAAGRVLVKPLRSEDAQCALERRRPAGASHGMHRGGTRLTGIYRAVTPAHGRSDGDLSGRISF
jgi:hypothetical protein